MNPNSHPPCLQSVQEKHYYQTKIKVKPRILNHLAKRGLTFTLCFLVFHNVEANNKKWVKTGQKSPEHEHSEEEERNISPDKLSSYP